MAAKIEKPKIKIWQRKGFLIGFAIVALLVAFYGVNEFNYQQKVNQLVSATNDIDKAVAVQGAQDRAQGVFAPFWLDQFGCVDTGPCPRASSSWFVLVETGKQAEFMTDLLKSTGFELAEDNGLSKTREAGGVKNDVGVMLELSSGGSLQAPSDAPVGKEWLRLSLVATPYDR